MSIRLSHKKRRALLVSALEIALGTFDDINSAENLRKWEQLVIQFKRDSLSARMLLQHLQSGDVLVVALAESQIEIVARRSEETPA